MAKKPLKKSIFKRFKQFKQFKQYISKNKFINKSINGLSLFYKEYKRVIISIVLFSLLLLMFIYGFKLYLFINHLLGNDVLIRMDISDTKVYLKNNEPLNISVDIRLFSNPFCRTQCYFSFYDISNNILLSEESKFMRSTQSYSNIYLVEAPNLGEGILIYRFKASCMSLQTWFCHTSGKTTERSVISLLEYNLNEDQELLKNKSYQNLIDLGEQISLLSLNIIKISDMSIYIHHFIESKNLILNLDLLKNNLIKFNTNLDNILLYWYNHSYSETLNLTINLNQQVSNSTNISLLLESKMKELIIDYNFIIDNINDLFLLFKEIHVYCTFLNDSDCFKSLNDFETTLEGYSDLLFEMSSLYDIDKNISYLFREVINLNEDKLDSVDLKLESLNKTLLFFYDTLCNVSNDCLNDEVIVDQNEDDLLVQSSDLESEHIINNLVINKTEEILLMCKAIDSAYELLMVFNITNYTEINFSSLLPLKCNISSLDYRNIIIPLNEINLSVFDEYYLLNNFTLEDPLPICCFKKSCNKCCINCSSNPDFFPLILLHGHAFNEMVSADYSMNLFTKLADKMEQDGYLNAGAITLYSPKDKVEGKWAMINVPLIIMTSYYYDKYYQPDDIILVQTKSENIDTYALRFKDLVDEIKIKTGRDKVNVLAHSMGGLVVRRYIQIFGDNDINLLMLVAVPNNGISGRIKTFCPIRGNSLECNDMSEGSLFLNRLNIRLVTNEIKIYNLIGTGCLMDQGVGDGIVTTESANLTNAINILVEGNCNKLEFLHNDILDINKYPEVYEYIISFLKEDKSD
jgi:uncharacterized alpha/beta hydrolase family protein